MQVLLALFIRWIIMAFTTPCQLVSLWLTPHTNPDPQINTLQRWRAWLGYAALVGVLYVSRDSVDQAELLNAALLAPFVKVAIAIPCFVVAVTLLVIKSGSGHRLNRLILAVRPWMTALVVMVAPVLIAVAAMQLFSETHNPVWWVVLIASLPLWPAAVWAVILGVRYSFRAVDVHPLLPAIVGSAVALATIAESVIQAATATSALDQRTALLSVGGGVVVGLLCAYELRRLNQDGFSFSSLPPPDLHPTVNVGVLTRRMAPWLVLTTALAIAMGSINQTVPGVRASPASGGGTASGASAGGPAAVGDVFAGRSEQIVPINDVSATSSAGDSQDASGAVTTFGAENLLDANPVTAWRTAGDATGQQITLTFSAPVKVTSVGLLPGYAKVDPVSGEDRFFQNRRIVAVRWIAADGSYLDQAFAETPEMQWLSGSVITPTLTVQILQTTSPGDRDFTAISDLEVHGIVGG